MIVTFRKQRGANAGPPLGFSLSFSLGPCNGAARMYGEPFLVG